MATFDAPLARRSFRRWLAARDPEAMVGTRGDIHHCPYATYLATDRGAIYQTVSPSGIYAQPKVYRDGVIDRSCPLWLARFIVRVDRSPSKEITAQVALDVLDAIEKEMH